MGDIRTIYFANRIRRLESLSKSYRSYKSYKSCNCCPVAVAAGYRIHAGPNFAEASLGRLRMLLLRRGARCSRLFPESESAAKCGGVVPGPAPWRELLQLLHVAPSEDHIVWLKRGN